MLRQHTIWACYPSAKCKPQLISVVSTFDFPGLLNNLNFSTLMFKRLKKIRKSELSQIKMFSPEKNTIEQILIDNQHHSAKKTKKNVGVPSKSPSSQSDLLFLKLETVTKQTYIPQIMI